MWEALLGGVKNFGSGLANMFNNDTLLGDGTLANKGIATSGLDFLNANKNAISGVGGVLSGVGNIYGQQQAAGLARQALNDQRANTLRNQTRQEEADRRLQTASDRVFGTSY